MSDLAGFAIRLPETAGYVEAPSVDLDLNAEHSFWFGRRLWLTGLGMCLQSTLLLMAGVFLLTQIISTPNLAVQIAITGRLLTTGGIAMFAKALGDFLTGLKVDRRGVRVRLGWKTTSVPWKSVDRWSMSAKKRKLKELPGITLWIAGHQKPFTVADGHLDERCRPRIHYLLRAFAHEKESA